MYYRKILLIPGEGWSVENTEGLDHYETLVYNHLIKNGYAVKKLDCRRKLNPKDESELREQLISPSLIIPGVPDFVCWKNDKLIFVEVKGGKSQLSEVQRAWVEAFSDEYDILLLRARLDKKDYLKTHNKFAVEGALIDGYTNTFETLNNLQDIRSDYNIPNGMWGDEEIELAISGLKDIKPEKAWEWTYYHLVAMEYPDWIIEDAKARINILLGSKNKNPTSYKKAYELLRASLERAQTLYKEHREKAERQLSGVIPKEKVDAVLKRRLAENKSLIRIRQKSKPAEDFEIKFKTGTELLDSNQNKDSESLSSA